MGAGNVFPSDQSIMAMQVSDLKARLYLWRERKPEFRGSPLFEQGKQGWLGGGRPALQDRLKKAVRHWQLENKPVQAEFTWTDETYDEDEGVSGDESEDEDEDDGYVYDSVMCVSGGPNYTASALFG